MVETVEEVVTEFSASNVMFRPRICPEPKSFPYKSPWKVKPALGSTAGK